MLTDTFKSIDFAPLKTYLKSNYSRIAINDIN